MSFGYYLKNIFFVIIILQFAPPLIRSVTEQYQDLLKQKTKVAKVSIDGVIDNAKKYTKDLKTYFEQDDIKAVLLEVESGGGAAGSSQALFQEIKHLKEQAKTVKPVVVRAENICASGAYYVACAADSIIASPSAFVGSVGVYLPKWELKEFINQFNLNYRFFKKGKYKTMTNPFAETTEEETALLEGLAQDTYDQFVKDVADNRKNLSVKDADNWANGKIFTGNQALKIGLIDKVGSQNTAEETIKELAPIEGEIEYVSPARPSKLTQWLQGEDAQTSLIESCINACYDVYTKTMYPHT
jgi:protease-4